MATRRNLEQTRRLILDAGVELMAQEGYSPQSANVSLIDACRRAGLATAGSAYKIWANQGAFRDELIRHALAVSGERVEASERVIEAVATLGDEPDLSSVIRVASTENVQAVVGQDWFARNVALWLAAARDEQLRLAHLESQHKLLTSLSETFGFMMELFDLEMRPPFTLEQLTLAVAAEMHGLGYFLAYDDETGASEITRPTGPDGEPERWHLLGCVIEALAEGFTRPKGKS